MRSRPPTAQAARLAALAALLVAVAFAPARAGAAAVTARDADSSVDSVGVNVHLGWTHGSYRRFEAVKGALERLGVRYVRDGIAQGRPDVDARFRALAAAGIKLDAVIGEPLHRYGSGSLVQQLDLVARDLGPEVVASIEGPNEFDNSGAANWLGILRRYVPRLWKGVRSRPALAAIPVLGPSLVFRESRRQLGDISPWTTEGNMHPYPGGRAPDDPAHIGDELALSAENTEGQPVQVTETGFTNSIHQTRDDPSLQFPTSERASAVYLPRLLLDHFRRGITRTYLYQLLDDRPDPARADPEANFGLLHADFSPKPGYDAVRNLISILADPGRSFRPGSLGFTVEGAGPSFRRVLLQKRDGSFWLALWNADPVWDPVRRTPVAAAAAPVTIGFDDEVAGTTTFKPGVSSNPISSRGRVGEVSLEVGPTLTILRIEPLDPRFRHLGGLDPLSF